MLGGAHITGSYSICLEGLPIFAGWVLSCQKPILLVLEEQCHLERAVRCLIRAGYDHIGGYLKDGIEGWYSVHQLKERIDRGEELVILDVRGQD